MRPHLSSLFRPTRHVNSAHAGSIRNLSPDGPRRTAPEHPQTRPGTYSPATRHRDAGTQRKTSWLMSLRGCCSAMWLEQGAAETDKGARGDKVGCRADTPQGRRNGLKCGGQCTVPVTELAAA